MAQDDVRRAYREAWDAWQKQIDHLHRVILEGEQIGPAQMKGLLNREARTKEAYDRARESMLGLRPEAVEPAPDGSNPFR